MLTKTKNLIFAVTLLSCLLACRAHAMQNPNKLPILENEVIDADEWLYKNYLEKKAQAEKKQKDLDEKLFIACYCNKTKDILDALNAGANPNILSNKKCPFMSCASFQNKEAIEAFLEKGIDIPSIEHIYSSTLSATAPLNDVTITQKLLDAGANVNLGNIFGTPIHNAIELVLPDMVQLLIKAGADLTIRNAQNETPLQRAHTWLGLNQRNGSVHTAEQLHKIIYYLGGDSKEKNS